MVGILGWSCSLLHICQPQMLTLTFLGCSESKEPGVCPPSVRARSCCSRALDIRIKPLLCGSKSVVRKAAATR